MRERFDIAGGLGIDRLRAQWDEIERVQQRVKIKLLKGTESDICEDGSLDYPDHVLEKFDIIIASIHARHKMDSEQMTQRLLRALKFPFFKIWGHPLGRLIGSRPPIACRMDEVLDTIVESKCAREVNLDPDRPTWSLTGFAPHEPGVLNASYRRTRIRLAAWQILIPRSAQ